jgi:hypothetical protein
MQRSVGVTISAVLALLGSLFAAGMGLLMLAAFIAGPPPSPDPNFPGSPAFFRTILFLVPLFYLVPAAWGITTSVGLFRLRNWARISIIVFAALLAIFGLFGMLGALVMFVMPAPAMPPGARLDPNFFLTVMRLFMVTIALVQMGIGIWWLVFFNRAGVKAQFVPPAVPYVPYPAAMATPPPPSAYPTPSAQPAQSPSLPAAPGMLSMPGRPVSITIIACYVLLGALFIPMNLLLRMPAVVMVSIVTGWPAVVYYLAMLGIHVYVGIGLLRLQPAARLVGIAYFVFALVNSAVFFLAPGALARITGLLEAQQSLFPWIRFTPGTYPYPFDVRPVMMVSAGVGLLFVLIPLCFLVINRQAFARSSAPAV